MMVEFRAPRNIAELNASIECSIRSFYGTNHNFSDAHFFSKIIKNDPRFSLGNTRSCFVNGEVVSTLQIFERPMRIGGSFVKMGGIGSVGTLPAHRGKGYSAMLLRDSVEYMRSENFDISLLSSKIPKLYESVGWTIFPVNSMTIDLAGKLQTPTDKNLTIERYHLDRMSLPLAQIYGNFNAFRTGTVVRSEQYWKNRRKWYKAPEPIRWVAKTSYNNKYVSYIEIKDQKIREFGYLEEYGESAILLLFHHVLKQFKDREITVVETHCPSEAQGQFEFLGCKVQRPERLTTMLRLINLKSLLSKISDLLEKRLAESTIAHWIGTIQIGAGEHRAVLKIDRGNVNISAVDVDLPPERSPMTTEAPVFQLRFSDQLSLLKLLVGDISVDKMALNSEQKKIISILFPSDQFLFWRTDLF